MGIIDEAAKQSNRKTYGKGFHDGIRAATAGHRADMMNESKLQIALKNMTAPLRKFYEFVPAQEPWTAQQILAEAARAGLSWDTSKAKGCLNGLVESGVVREPQRGFFIRTEIRTAKQQEPEPNMPTVQPLRKVITNDEPRQQEAPEDGLMAVAERVRKLADDVRAIAHAIESAAVMVVEKEQRCAEETKKLRQLQELLKSISN